VNVWDVCAEIGPLNTNSKAMKPDNLDFMHPAFAQGALLVMILKKTLEIIVRLKRQGWLADLF
jgi:hypothetical protein